MNTTNEMIIEEIHNVMEDKEYKPNLDIIKDFCINGNKNIIIEGLNCCNHAKNKVCKNPFIFFAVLVGDIEIVSILLARGIDINCYDYTHFRPIYNAIEKNDIHMIKFLQKKGACLKRKVNYGNVSCISHAITHKHNDLVQYFIDQNMFDNDHYKECFKLASKKGLLDIGKTLLNTGFDIDTYYDSKGKYNINCLSHAAGWGQFNMAKLLLEEYGADPNTVYTSEHGYTIHPMESAARNGYLDIVKLLTKHDFNINSTHGANALYSACKQNHFETVKFLLDNNAPVTHVDSHDYDYRLHNCYSITQNEEIKKLILEKEPTIIDHHFKINIGLRELDENMQS